MDYLVIQDLTSYEVTETEFKRVYKLLPFIDVFEMEINGKEVDEDVIIDSYKNYIIISSNDHINAKINNKSITITGE